MQDAFEVQDAIARKIAEALRVARAPHGQVTGGDELAVIVDPENIPWPLQKGIRPGGLGLLTVRARVDEWL